MKRLAYASLCLAVVGVMVGLATGQALGATIYCSHQYPACIGSWSADDIYGWENGNEVDADPGRDNVWGYGQQDWLFGDDDADALFGGVGGDTVKGLWGNDSYYWVPGGAGFGVYGNSENDIAEGNIGNDLVEGDYGSDYMAGGDDSDYLKAEDGQGDTVHGGAGTDACWVDGYDSWDGCEAVY